MLTLIRLHDSNGIYLEDVQFKVVITGEKNPLPQLLKSKYPEHKYFLVEKTCHSKEGVPLPDIFNAYLVKEPDLHGAINLGL